MNRRGYTVAGALAIALALPFLVAQVGPAGGLPTKPRFRSVEIGADRLPGIVDGAQHVVGTNPTLRLYETDEGTDEKYWNNSVSAGCWRLLTRTDANGAGATPLNVCRGTGTTVDLIALIATEVRVNGINLTPESGTFTASFGTACTTTPTVTFDYQKVGNVVTIASVGSSGFPCTGDSTSFDTVSAAIPASIRPTAGGGTSFGTAVLQGFTDNSAATWGIWLFETDGSIRAAKCATHGAACSATGWTAALNRNVPSVPSSFTYMLGDP